MLNSRNIYTSSKRGGCSGQTVKVGSKEGDAMGPTRSQKYIAFHNGSTLTPWAPRMEIFHSSQRGKEQNTFPFLSFAAPFDSPF
jgi:hypothetical protein